MLKYLTSFIPLVVLSTVNDPAQAQSVATCTLKGPGFDIVNECAMVRRGNITTVKMGAAFLTISRFPDEEGSAILNAHFKDGTHQYLGMAVARGGCWIGAKVKFCAGDPA